MGSHVSSGLALLLLFPPLGSSILEPDLQTFRSLKLVRSVLISRILRFGRVDLPELWPPLVGYGEQVPL